MKHTELYYALFYEFCVQIFESVLKMPVHCCKMRMASLFVGITTSSSSPSFLLRQEVVYSLLEELVIVNDGCVPMRGVSNPLGAPVVAVALKQNVWVELKLLLSAQKLPDLGRALCEQPQALVNIVPEIIVAYIQEKYRPCVIHSYLGIFHTPSANRETALKSPASIACRGPPYSHS